MITIQTLVTGNCPEIKNLFASVAHLNTETIVVNLGADQETIDICEEHNAHIIYAMPETDYSAALNAALHHKGYYLYMHPWEQLLTFDASLDERAYNVTVITSDIVVKEARIWNKETGIRFRNPICPVLNESTAYFCNCVLLSQPEPNLDRKLELIREWNTQEPHNSDAIYYYSTCLLALGKHKDFLNVAERYMRSNSKKTIASTMHKYYYAMVKALIMKESRPAIQNIIQCLTVNPLMAEFWCLLGDIYYNNIRRYDMAIEFYENATILGTRRLTNDKWPADISKYEEYPLKMIQSCKDLMASRVILKPLHQSS